MTVQVWHFVGQDPHLVFHEQAAVKWPMSYRHVADVEADTLDDAYRLTNHIDAPWWTNPGVTKIGSDARSTSVGDVVVDDVVDEPMVVASFGFKRVADVQARYTI